MARSGAVSAKQLPADRSRRSVGSPRMVDPQTSPPAPSGGHKVRRKAVDEIDIAVSKAVRFFRIQAGMTQATLGDDLGVSFHQIQKYEKGVNRIGSGPLLKIAKLFNRPVTAFYPKEHHERLSTKSSRSPTDRKPCGCCTRFSKFRIPVCAFSWRTSPR